MEANKGEFTREQIQKAVACKTAEELMALAKAEGFDVTKEQAQAFLDEFADRELDFLECFFGFPVRIGGHREGANHQASHKQSCEFFHGFLHKKCKD